MENGSDRNQLDTVYHCLSSHQRREIIRRLEDTDEIDFDTLTDELATELDRNRTEIATQLHHHDLPVLDDAGLIAYDAETGTVEPGVAYRMGCDFLPDQ